MIKIISPGIYSSVQDMGRKGYRRFGMPLSGAMDPYAYSSCNKILNNSDGAAVIEITGIGFECEFTLDTAICVTGADLNAILCSADSSGTRIQSGQVVQVSSGSSLEFKKSIIGLRAYIGVAGGIRFPEFLGSQSMIKGQKLMIGDELMIGSNSSEQVKCDYDSSYISRDNTYSVKVRFGPDACLYSKKHFKAMLAVEYTVSNYHDRMGIRLKGLDKMFKIDENIVTKPVFPGCIQLPSGGNPIIIMNDGQTTGGYPVWAVIQQEDMRIAGQLKSGDKVKFICV